MFPIQVTILVDACNLQVVQATVEAAKAACSAMNEHVTVMEYKSGEAGASCCQF